MRYRYLQISLLLLLSLGCALVAPTTPPPSSSTATPSQPTPPPTPEPPTATPEPPTATPEPPQPTPTPITALNDATFDFGQGSIGYSHLLVKSITARLAPEVIVEQEGPDFSSPQHLVLTLQGYPRQAGSYFEGEIYLYPVSRYIELYSGAEATIAALQALLASRPPLPIGDPRPDLPFLPPANAAQMLVTQAHYLDFGSGSGIRYLTQYGQAILPINNQALFYTYQGLSADGQTYISAILPVAHPLLPADGNTPPGGNWDAFYNQYETYLQETAQALDIQPPEAFIPNLTLLDAMMASLTLHP